MGVSAIVITEKVRHWSQLLKEFMMKRVESIHGSKYNSEYRMKTVRECIKYSLNPKTIYSKIHKHGHILGNNELF